MGRPTKLDGARLEVVVEQIRLGAFDWVAAEAAGIGQRTFYEWLERGRRGEAKYAAFEAAVRRARAEARQGAEQWVRQHNPLAWLRLGPGRERRGKPGWTGPTKAGDEGPEGEELERDDPAALEEFALMVREAGWDLDGPGGGDGRPCCGHRCAGSGGGERGRGGEGERARSGEGSGVTEDRGAPAAVAGGGGEGGGAVGAGGGRADARGGVREAGRRGGAEGRAPGLPAGRISPRGREHGRGGAGVSAADRARPWPVGDWWPVTRAGWLP